MQFVKGVLLHKKQFTTKTGKTIPVISVLDENQTFSQVLDITDFDEHAKLMKQGVVLQIPVKIKAIVSEKGNPYLNYVTAGPAEVSS